MDEAKNHLENRVFSEIRKQAKIVQKHRKCEKILFSEITPNSLPN
jgi:hypothetical protein